MDTLEKIKALIEDLSDRVSNLEKMQIQETVKTGSLSSQLEGLKCLVEQVSNEGFKLKSTDKEWVLLKDAAKIFNRSPSYFYAILNKDWDKSNKYPLLRGVFWRKSGLIEINKPLFDIWLTSGGDRQTCIDAVKKWTKSKQKSLGRSA